MNHVGASMMPAPGPVSFNAEVMAITNSQERNMPGERSKQSARRYRLADDVAEKDVERIVTLASSFYGSEAPEAIAYCGMESWMNCETGDTHRFAKAFRRLRN